MASRKRARTYSVQPFHGESPPPPAAPARPPRPPHNKRPPETNPGRADRRIGTLMLPLRLFLGATLVYAGLVKLIDPSFLDPNAPGSLVSQLHAFARDSPLAPLITAVGIPFAGQIGLLIALGELAVGLGALTGIGAKASAWGGFVISILFWLTASWAIKPFFYGPDLPYAVGWLTLALVGDGGRYVLRGATFENLFRRLGGQRQRTAETWSEDRRAATETIVLGAAAFVLAAIALQRPGWLRDLLGGSASPGSGVTGGSGGVNPSASPGPGSSAVPSAVPSGSTIGTLASVNAAGSATFTVPSTGDPGILVKLANGSIVAFDATCTHAGCPVEWVAADRALECPCHGAAFDPAKHGAVLGGPTNQPLLELPISIDHNTGQIILTG